MSMFIHGSVDMAHCFNIQYQLQFYYIKNIGHSLYKVNEICEKSCLNGFTHILLTHQLWKDRMYDLHLICSYLRFSLPHRQTYLHNHSAPSEFHHSLHLEVMFHHQRVFASLLNWLYWDFLNRLRVSIIRITLNILFSWIVYIDLNPKWHFSWYYVNMKCMYNLIQTKQT